MQVQTVTNSAGKRATPRRQAAAKPRVRDYRRLAARYGEVAGKEIKRLMLRWQAEFGDRMRARLFSDEIERAAVARVAADNAIRLACEGKLDPRVSAASLDRTAQRAECDLRRLMIPDILTACGGDVASLALLSAMGLSPHSKHAEAGSSGPVSDTAAEPERASGQRWPNGGDHG
jgi:hypothetical protein